MDTVGDRLKFIIESRHMSQGKFADFMGCPRQLISNYANNLSKPNWDFLTKLHNELKINLNWFITGFGEKINQTPNEALKEELRRDFEKLLASKGL